MKSIYGDSEYTETVNDLKAELTRLRTEFKDTSDQDVQPGRRTEAGGKKS